MGRVAPEVRIETSPPSSLEPQASPAESPAPPSAEQLRHAWPEVLAALEGISRTAWIVAERAQVRGFDDDVLALGFPSQRDIEAFRPESEHLRQAIAHVIGVRVKFTARAEGAPTGAVPTLAPDAAAAPEPEPASAPAPAAPPASAGWDVAPIPSDDAEPPYPEYPEPMPDAASVPEPMEAASAPASSGVSAAPTDTPTPSRPETPPPSVVPASVADSSHRPAYGEAVVRGILGAKFIGEHPVETPGETGTV